LGSRMGDIAKVEQIWDAYAQRRFSGCVALWIDMDYYTPYCVETRTFLDLPIFAPLSKTFQRHLSNQISPS